MKSPGVYRITNLVTKRNYIGSSSRDWKNRRNGHLFLLKKGIHPSKKMQEDWNAHGAESFKFFCVCECSADRSLDLEKAACLEYKAFDVDFGYNTAPIKGKRFRGGRPAGTDKVRFTRMVPVERVKDILRVLEMDDGLVSVEAGSHKGLVGNYGDKRVVSLHAPLPPVSEDDPFGVGDNLDWMKNLEERKKPHPLGHGDALEISRLKQTIIKLESKVKEYEVMLNGA